MGEIVTSRTGSPVLTACLVISGLLSAMGVAVAQTVVVDTSHVANTFSPPHALGAAIDRLKTGTQEKLLTNPLLKEILNDGLLQRGDRLDVHRPGLGCPHQSAVNTNCTNNR